LASKLSQVSARGAIHLSKGIASSKICNVIHGMLTKARARSLTHFSWVERNAERIIRRHDGEVPAVFQPTADVCKHDRTFAHVGYLPRDEGVH
jgi:hypothetical protein